LNEKSYSVYSTWKYLMYYFCPIIVYNLQIMFCKKRSINYGLFFAEIRQVTEPVFGVEVYQIYTWDKNRPVIRKSSEHYDIQCLQEPYFYPFCLYPTKITSSKRSKKCQSIKNCLLVLWFPYPPKHLFTACVCQFKMTTKTRV